jgi:hypothetical protein
MTAAHGKLYRIELVQGSTTPALALKTTPYSSASTVRRFVLSFNVGTSEDRR